MDYGADVHHVNGNGETVFTMDDVDPRIRHQLLGND